MHSQNMFTISSRWSQVNPSSVLKKKEGIPHISYKKKRRVNTKTTIFSIYVWSSDSYTNKQSNYLLIKGNSKVNWCSIFQPFINRAWLWFNDLEYSPLVM